jgi:hypothetical protein
MIDGVTEPVEPAERPLTGRERATLDFLLSQDFPGAPELRAQTSSAWVSGRCGCGCPTVHLSVDAAAQVATVSSTIPVEAVVSDSPGDSVLLFVKGGHLDSLEYVWIGSAPREFPTPDRLVVRAR